MAKKLLELLEDIREKEGNILLDDAAYNWDIDNLIDALKGEEDDGTEYVYDGYNIIAIDEDGYLKSIAVYVGGS